VVSYQGADVEKIASLDPDLVIAGGHNLNRPDDIAKLRSLGIPVLVVYAPDLKGILADIALVGRVVGRSEQATAIQADIQSAFDEVKAATASLSAPRVYAELDATGGYWLPAPDDLLTDMIRTAGGDPLTSGTPGLYQIDSEKIVAFDPEVILLSDTYAVKIEDVGSRSGWSVLSAVKSGDVRPIDATTATRPGPRLADGIREVALAIHPDLLLPGASTAPAATASQAP
jgi:iron complex transport system substrate-binding protein